MRMWQGASGWSDYDGIVSPAYTVITPINPAKQNVIFWAYYFKDTNLIHLFQKYSQGLTSDTWNLKFNQFASIKVWEPSYEVQSKIADWFSVFDKKIYVEELKLLYLESLKKSFLINMFI